MYLISKFAHRRALQSGSQMLELDVRLTKDGQVVVFHDPDLLRLTGSPLRISEVSYNSLPALNATIPIDTIPGIYFNFFTNYYNYVSAVCIIYSINIIVGETWQDSSWSEMDRKIPLLKQLFEEFPNVPMNIDLKDCDIRLVTKVSHLIKEYKREKYTVWGSFNNHCCQLCVQEVR